MHRLRWLAIPGILSLSVSLPALCGTKSAVGAGFAPAPGASPPEWPIKPPQIDDNARDTPRVSQLVPPEPALKVHSVTLQRLDKLLTLPVLPPEGASQGEVRVTLAASLTDGQGALRQHMRILPAVTLEQKVSAAVALRDTQAWDALMQSLSAQLDDHGLARMLPAMAQGDPALTAYVLSIAHEAGWALPQEARARMLRALEDYASGRLEAMDPPWLDRLARLTRRLHALEALARHGRAMPALLTSLEPAPESWPTAALVAWIGLLKASPGLPDRDPLLEAALEVLKARIYYVGRRLTFGHEARDRSWWQLSSPDTDAVRALLAVMDLPQWQAELPRLTMGVLARQTRGHWNTPTANAWGALAMERFTRRYEPLRPDGLSYVWLGWQGRYVDWRLTPRGATASFPMPADEADVRLMHLGAGQPYVTLTLLAAAPGQEAQEQGYRITRQVEALERRQSDRLSRGDIVRIRIEIDAREDMGWVMVEDPTPPGATLQDPPRWAGQGVGANPQAVRPVWEQHLVGAYRAYFAYLPRGRHRVEYTLRLMHDGLFHLPPTRVEALYAPELRGSMPNGVIKIAP